MSNQIKFVHIFCFFLNFVIRKCVIVHPYYKIKITCQALMNLTRYYGLTHKMPHLHLQKVKSDDQVYIHVQYDCKQLLFFFIYYYYFFFSICTYIIYTLYLLYIYYSHCDYCYIFSFSLPSFFYVCYAYKYRILIMLYYNLSFPKTLPLQCRFGYICTMPEAFLTTTSCPCPDID